MKLLWALGIVMLGSAATGAAIAAPSTTDDFVVISVLPRSPAINPIVMSVPARVQPKNTASLQMGAFTPVADKQGAATADRVSHP